MPDPYSPKLLLRSKFNGGVEVGRLSARPLRLNGSRRRFLQPLWLSVSNNLAEAAIETVPNYERWRCVSNGRASRSEVRIYCLLLLSFLSTDANRRSLVSPRIRFQGKAVAVQRAL